MSGRVALVVSDQMENVFGGFYSTGFEGSRSAGMQGIFAQPANSGRTTSTQFAVVPGVQIKIGSARTPAPRAPPRYAFR